MLAAQTMPTRASFAGRVRPRIEEHEILVDGEQVVAAAPQLAGAYVDPDEPTVAMVPERAFAERAVNVEGDLEGARYEKVDGE